MKISAAILVVLLSITPTLTNGVTIAQWTFESSVPTTAGPIAPEIGSGEAIAFHADSQTTFSNPLGNGSSEAWSANRWSVDDYWQFSVSTFGFKDIHVSFDQYGSKTGPGDFGLQYSTDGINFSTFARYVLPSAGSWDSGSFDLSSEINLNNGSTVYFRLDDNSTVPTDSADYSAVRSGGTDRIDNFTVCGTAESSAVPDSLPLHCAAAALFGVLVFARRLWPVVPGRMPN